MPDDTELIRLRSWRSAAMGYSVCVFLVRDQLIDTGFPGARKAVARLIDQRRPRGVIVTHQHEDHAGNVDLVAGRGIPIAMARATQDALREGEANSASTTRGWGPMPPLTTGPRRMSLWLELIKPPDTPDQHVVWDAERRKLSRRPFSLGSGASRCRWRIRGLARVSKGRRARARRAADAHRGAGLTLRGIDWSGVAG